MASPRTSVAPPGPPERGPREGLSAQTLIIAALASGLAAVLVSQFWEQGTIFASAMTPVVVAIVSELLHKPVESERVRGSVRAASGVARPRSGRTPKVMAPPAPGVEEGLERRERGVEAGPVRVYSSGSNRRPTGLASPRRRLQLRIALLTGLVAFAIAAAALTLPELILGGSVGGGSRDTTYFGGGGGGGGKASQGRDSTGHGGSGSKPGPGPAAPRDRGNGSAEPPKSAAPAPQTQDPPAQDTAPATPPPAPPQAPSTPVP